MMDKKKKKNEMLLNKKRKQETPTEIALSTTHKKSKEKQKENTTLINQGYIIIPQDKKTSFLITFLKKHQNSKIIISFTLPKLVTFYQLLLPYFHISNIFIENDITSFTKAQHGVLLLSTELTSLKQTLPLCEWYIMYEPTLTKEEYNMQLPLERNRNYENTKVMVLVLENEKEVLNNELKFLKKFAFNEKQILKEEQRICKFVTKKDHAMYIAAYEAYRAFIFDYAKRDNKNVFDVKLIDEVMVCKNFGFETPLYVDLTTTLPIEEQVALAKKNKGLKRFHISDK
jgi:hypothetical protein